jgi:uncharacterized membrane protein
MQAARKVNGRVLWANLFLPFWVSPIPLLTRWMNKTNFAGRQPPGSPRAMRKGVGSCGRTSAS